MACLPDHVSATSWLSLAAARVGRSAPFFALSRSLAALSQRRCRDGPSLHPHSPTAPSLLWALVPEPAAALLERRHHRSWPLAQRLHKVPSSWFYSRGVPLAHRRNRREPRLSCLVTALMNLQAALPNPRRCGHLADDPLDLWGTS